MSKYSDEYIDENAPMVRAYINLLGEYCDIMLDFFNNISNGHDIWSSDKLRIIKESIDPIILIAYDTKESSLIQVKPNLLKNSSQYTTNIQVTLLDINNNNLANKFIQCGHTIMTTLMNLNGHGDIIIGDYNFIEFGLYCIGLDSIASRAMTIYNNYALQIGLLQETDMELKIIDPAYYALSSTFVNTIGTAVSKSVQFESIYSLEKIFIHPRFYTRLPIEEERFLQNYKPMSFEPQAFPVSYSLEEV